MIIIPLSYEQPKWHCIVADVERHILCMNNVMHVAARSWCLLQRVFVFKNVVIVLNGMHFIRSDTQAQTGTDKDRSFRQDD